MKIHSEADIEALVRDDPWMMQVLRAAETLNLHDWWIGAGFLRNRVWDAMEDIEPQPSKDVDLVYFDPENIAAQSDWDYDEAMKQQFPFAEWEIRTQARMHYVNGFEPYSSTADGISHWVETATCIAVKIENNELKFLFCYGTDDLFGLIARPTPYFTGDLLKTFHERVEKKQWQKRWPDLKVKTK